MKTALSRDDLIERLAATHFTKAELSLLLLAIQCRIEAHLDNGEHRQVFKWRRLKAKIQNLKSINTKR